MPECVLSLEKVILPLYRSYSLLVWVVLHIVMQMQHLPMCVWNLMLIFVLPQYLSRIRCLAMPKVLCILRNHLLIIPLPLLQSGILEELHR